MGQKLPFVAFACICEKVLQDKDNVFSLIRVVDTYYLQPPTEMPKDAVPGLELSGAISVKSGELEGEFEMSIYLRSPAGNRKAITEKPISVVLNGNEHGFNVKMQFTIAVKEYGLYWFDVMWGGEPLTSIPLKLVPGTKPEHP